MVNEVAKLNSRLCWPFLCPSQRYAFATLIYTYYSLKLMQPPTNHPTHEITISHFAKLHPHTNTPHSHKVPLGSDKCRRRRCKTRHRSLRAITLKDVKVIWPLSRLSVVCTKPIPRRSYGDNWFESGGFVLSFLFICGFRTTQIWICII